MDTMLQYKCPSCGGALNFDSALQKVKCPYCDTEFEMETLKELDEALKAQPAEDMSWQSSAGGQWQADEEESLISYICQSCGGEIVADANTAATSCPFCSNPVVITGRLQGQLRPDLVIPFKLDKEAAKAALSRHLTGKRLLPKIFKDANRLQEIKGVYVPFWIFDADAGADIHYRATRVRSWSDRDYVYTETNHYDLHRAGTLGFAGVPVDGSEKMADAMMEAIEPYDLSEAVDFQTAYLAGYFADKYDVSAEQGVNRVNERIRASTEEAISKTISGYNSVTKSNTSMQLKNSKAKYALYPVWLLHTRYQNTDYLFAMNGQTGKLVGDLPIDKGASKRWWFGVAAIAAVAAYLASSLLGLF